MAKVLGLGPESLCVGMAGSSLRKVSMVRQRICVLRMLDVGKLVAGVAELDELR